MTVELNGGGFVAWHLSFDPDGQAVPHPRDIGETGHLRRTAMEFESETATGPNVVNDSAG